MPRCTRSSSKRPRTEQSREQPPSSRHRPAALLQTTVLQQNPSRPWCDQRSHRVGRRSDRRGWRGRQSLSRRHRVGSPSRKPPTYSPVQDPNRRRLGGRYGEEGSYQAPNLSSLQAGARESAIRLEEGSTPRLPSAQCRSENPLARSASAHLPAIAVGTGCQL